MKKIFAVFLPAFAFACILPFIKPVPVTEHAGPEKDGPGNPMWIEQYKKLKGINGEIPEGIWSEVLKNIQAQQAMNKTAAAVLLNVTEAGPANVGGRVRSIIQDESNHNVLWAAGVSGGVWKTTDKGTTWMPVNDFAATLSVTSLTQDHFDHDIIYYGTGEPAGNSAGIGGAGIFKSTDGGSTFSQLPATDNSNFSRIWMVKASPFEANVLYVGTSGKGLWKSTDAGVSFTNVLAPTSTVTDIEIFPDSSVMATVSTDGLYYSSTGNNGTFSKLSGGLPVNGFKRVEIDYCDSFPNYVYAQFEDSTSSGYYSDLKGIWKSTDGGSSWTQTAQPSGTFSFPWYAFMFEVRPDNKDFVVTGSVSARVTTDGGNNWSSLSYSHADYHVALFDKDNPANFYIGNDGGLHLYNASSMTSTSTSLNNGFNVTQFYTGAFAPQNITSMGGCQDNGTNYSQAGSQTFTHIFGGDGAACAINQQNPDISFVSYQYGRIYRADDSYLLYPNYYSVLNELDADMDFDVDDGTWFINPFEINLMDGNQVYFVTDLRIWRTTNGALNWTPLTLTLGSGYPYSVGLSESTNPVAYIGGTSGMFYRVNNAATAVAGSEVDLSSSVPSGISSHTFSNIVVHPNDSSVAYVSSSNFSSQPRVWKVTDATSASPVWTPVAGDLPSQLPVNWIEIDPADPDSTFMAATDFGLYVTTNGGQTWSKDPVVPNVPIHQIRLRRTDRKLFVFTHGRGVWTGDLPGVPVSASEEIAASAIKVWPNPAVDKINISLPQAGAQVRLMDMQGRMILQQQMGSETSLPVSGLDQGIYLVEITTTTQRVVRKVIVGR